MASIETGDLLGLGGGGGTAGEECRAGKEGGGGGGGGGGVGGGGGTVRNTGISFSELCHLTYFSHLKCFSKRLSNSAAVNTKCIAILPPG